MNKNEDKSMEHFQRVFNLGSKTYLYTRTTNQLEELDTKMISRLVHNNELKKDVWSPVIKKAKYGDSAYSYENFKTGETVLADNFRSSKVYEVTRKTPCKSDNTPIGSIRNNTISTKSNDQHVFELLKKIKAMIKKF